MPFGIDVGYETGYSYPEPGVLQKRATPRSRTTFGPRVAGSTGTQLARARAGLLPNEPVEIMQAGMPAALLPAAIGTVAGGLLASAGMPQPLAGPLGGLAATGIGGASPVGNGAAIGEPWWFEGPFLREPPAEYLVKEWHRTVDAADGDFRLQYYLVKLPSRPYRIYMYNTKTKVWKSWGIPRPAVIGKNMPSHQMLTRLRRNLKKHVADANTILMVASPTTYAKNRGFRKYGRRRR